MKKDFWENWKKKTEIEKRAIKSIKKARAFIIKSIPKKALVAIYIKGSFARREMKEESDVDIVPIVSANKFEGKVFEVNSPEIYPVVVVPLSLSEFKKNKLFTKSSISPDLRAEPDIFLKKIKEYKLIYGRPINSKGFPIRKDKSIFKNEIHKIKKGYIPSYIKGKIPFSPLLKEVFWLTELEQEMKGVKVKHSIQEIAQSVKDKNHIVHDAFKLRLHPKKDSTRRKAFIRKLKIHLKNLEEIVRDNG